MSLILRVGKRKMKNLLAVCILAAPIGLAVALPAQPAPAPITIDATLPAPAPEIGFLHLGGVSPNGHRLSINSRYLSLDDKPWLPVMGEFHFSRYPEKYWQEELLKMKAGGVQVVAAYVFWIHHEEVEGQFDWTAQRDLRRFVQLCAQDGLYVYLRIGPWDHGEARNGGFPDWLVNKKIPLRRNDPEYLKYVSRLYTQIGSQVKGQFWQQGGPILGVQLENEYGETGPGAGAEHLAELKRLAIAGGITPPLFSITGWPENTFPAREFFPVFGGYPDDFWSDGLVDNPPSPVYMFARYRYAGDMAAIASADPAGKVDLSHYPFFTAESGGGMQVAYHRRPLIQPGDIAPLVVTSLGSGVNLFGYYVFQGGANPVGKLTTLQESTASGYPNDLPQISYDFQAPLGQYGQERESFRKIKSLHLFLQSFGQDLAAMAPYAPAQEPKDAGDTAIARVRLRAHGDRGFLFVNNYVRQLQMPEKRGFQMQIKLPFGDVNVPERPIDLPANTSFIWPLNLDLGVGTLRYSTAQLLTRLDKDGESTWFFFAIPGLRAEFAFDAASIASVKASSGSITRIGGDTLVQGAEPGKKTVLRIAGKDGRTTRIVLFTEIEAEQLWRVSLGGQDKLLLSAADIFAGDDGVHLRSVDPSRIAASLFVPGGGREGHPLWQERTWKIEPRKIEFAWNQSREASLRPPLRKSAEGRAKAPDDSEFAGAAAWTLRIPPQSMTGLSDIFLRIHYAGDVARLSRDGRLLDDNFYNGRTWEIGLKRFLPESFAQKLEVEVLPLPANAPIYLDAQALTPFDSQKQTAKVLEVEALPEYEVVWTPERK